jgi:hypothetical protein
MENKIGKFKFAFTPKGMPDCKSPNTYNRTFTEEGQFDAFIEEMDERGYHFHDAWDFEEYMSQLCRPRA